MHLPRTYTCTCHAAYWATQDLPWLLPPGAPVSFTELDAADAYAPVKNALADAAQKAAAGQSPGAVRSPLRAV